MFHLLGARFKYTLTYVSHVVSKEYHTQCQLRFEMIMSLKLKVKVFVILKSTVRFKAV